MPTKDCRHDNVNQGTACAPCVGVDECFDVEAVSIDFVLVCKPKTTGKHVTNAVERNHRTQSKEIIESNALTIDGASSVCSVALDDFFAHQLKPKILLRSHRRAGKRINEFE